MRNKTLGFSLVEVALSIAIIAFALLTLLALLPVGVQSNHVSAEETRAALFLTTLNADLCGSTPTGTNPSTLLGIQNTPYRQSGGVTALDYTLLPGTSHAITYYFDDSEKNVGTGATPPANARFRLTLLYVSVPTTGTLAPSVARAIISWPAQNNPLAVTQGALVNCLESILTFPAP